MLPTTESIMSMHNIGNNISARIMNFRPENEEFKKLIMTTLIVIGLTKNGGILCITLLVI